MMIPISTHPAVTIFIETLPPDVQAKTLRTTLLLEEFGPLLTMPHSKHIGGKLFELRIRSYLQVRLIYGFANNKALIAHGFIKKTEKIPPKEMRVARKRFGELARL
jgi:phage-related protein